MNWPSYPLIRLIIPFTSGMIGANLFILHMDTEVLFILCCVVLAFSFFLVKHPHIQREGTFGIVAMMLFFLIGMTFYTGKYRHIENGIPADSTYVWGTLVEQPRKKAHSWALELEQENGTHIIVYIGNRQKVLGNRQNEAGSQPQGLSLGDTIYANVRHLHATHHCENDTFKTYNNYLFHHDICATAYAPRHRWKVSPRRTGTSLLLTAKNMQENLHKIYEEQGINEEAGSIIEAMTIGRKVDLSSDTRTAYSHAGISHILALSGFHVGIIVLMMQMFLLKSFLPFRWQWVSNLCIIAALWGYAFLTGLSPSLVRSAIMFTILLLCQFLNREPISINGCSLAFAIMLCLNPFYLHDIGFQLSFLAVGGISLLSKKIVVLCTSSSRTIRFMWLITIIAISLISTLFTAPLVAHHFGQFSLISPISNLLLFPFVYLLIGTSILWWLFLWCDPINNLLTDLLNWTASTMNNIVEWLSSLPFSTISWRPNIFITLLCYVLLLAASYCFLWRRVSFSFRDSQMKKAISAAAKTIKTMHAQVVSHQ